MKLSSDNHVYQKDCICVGNILNDVIHPNLITTEWYKELWDFYDLKAKSEFAIWKERRN